uniref:Major facilitator superfamily (MFS) profile domain-containing protein n=1 Tax=Pristionchus pacificus TaxID=54126 RepID=A0A8R1UHL0_PRIPA
MADSDRMVVDGVEEERGRETPRGWMERIKHPKTTLVAVLLTVNLLNYMDRFTIAGVLTQLQAYFHMDDKQAGMLQTMFIVFYMLCAPICGILGDRYNRKLIMSVGLSIWIVAVLLSSFVGRDYFALFLLLRGMVGVGEASYSTVAPTIIADSFTGADRSAVLMVFYFAIPVGSGLGYIGGAYVSLWTGAWQWGVRFTPMLGIICLLLLIFVLDEPARGEAEHAEGMERTTVKEDLVYLTTIPTFRWTTAGFTAVVFAAGSLAWWTPSLVEHAYAVQHGTSVVPEDEKASVALKFGLITACAGLTGVTIGSTVAGAWREGRWGLRASHRADAVVCGLGALAAVPALFACLITASHYINVAWCFVFLAVTLMCLNWAINMDILMYVIVANRRATATAIQTMISHLFGDATSPYIVGVVSDWVRGDDVSQVGSFFSLQTALFIPNAVLVFGGAAYLYATFHVVEDQRIAAHRMHVHSAWDDDDEESGRAALLAPPPPARSPSASEADEEEDGGDDVQVLVRN